MKKLFAILLFSASFACGKTLERPERLNADFLKQHERMIDSKFYDFKLNDIDGKEVDFSQFKGKKVLLVNVASECGYTPQYEALQELHENYGDQIAVLAFPANNFGGQEPGSNEEIKEFCTSTYGVTFPVFEKISVKGFDKHPLYRWLSDEKENGWNNQEPSWNFCKYYVNENGELEKFFPSSITPLDEAILSLIDQ
ncbi:glutathione peroxidase [Algoriphagus sp.]|uniref:glutathione peroxidase n=1 Tax=Algoriphagus sp. TaxID=1872435 RepID=UPI00260366E7|nr:glutathione peroxidase [Algoriphagus sp.]